MVILLFASHLGHPDHPGYPGHPGDHGHPDHPGYPGHTDHSGHFGHPGHPDHPGYPVPVSQSVYRAEYITVLGSGIWVAIGAINDIEMEFN